MEKSSSLDRLMSNRSRPKVPKRTDFIDEANSQDITPNNSNDVNTSLSQDVKITINTDEIDKTGQLFEDIITVRSTTRLEESIDARLRHLCTDEKITKETWIEAAFLYLTEHPDGLKKVNEIAQQRLSKRKEIADLKRAMTMKERLEQKLRHG